MLIKTNLSSLTAQRNLLKSQSALGQSISRLSSGLRINSAADDAAGLAIANRMSSHIRGAVQAQRNINDGASLLQTAQGALGSVNDALQRIRELAVAARSQTYTDENVQAMQDEVDQLLAHINQVGASASFNGINLFRSDSNLSLQVGASGNDVLDLGLQAISTISIGLDTITDPFRLTWGGGNPLQVSEPITQVTVSGQSYALKLDLIGDDTQGTHTLEETAAHFGVSPSSVTVHRVIDPATGLERPNVFAVKFGNHYLYARESQLILDDTAQEATIFVPETWQAFEEDPVNGTTTMVTDAWRFPQIGLNEANKIVVYYDYKDLAYLTNNFVVSGPGVNGFKVRYGYDATDNALGLVDAAIARVDEQRGYLGALQNRLDSVTTNLTSQLMNTSAARSRIEDANFAQEVSNLSRSQMLSSAAQSVLAQANQLSEGVLKLLA